MFKYKQTTKDLKKSINIIIMYITDIITIFIDFCYINDKNYILQTTLHTTYEG